MSKEKKKHMRKNILLFVSVCLLTIGSIAQTTVGGIAVPGALKVGDKSLTLNGAGIRKKLFIEVYVGSLYVTNKSQDGPALAASNENMVMRINITSGMVTSEKMYEATMEGFQKSTGGNMAPIQAKVNTFLALFKKEEIKKGDYFDLVYNPSTGVTVSKNGKILETISGLDFKTALFGIWLGKTPVDDGLKAGLLGQSK